MSEETCPESADQMIAAWEFWDAEKAALGKAGKARTLCYLCGRLVDEAEASQIAWGHWSQLVDVCGWCEDSVS